MSKFVKIPKLNRAKIKITKSNLNISLPLKLRKYLKVDSELYYIPLNGTIQLCGEKPNISIPFVKIDKSKFLAHS